MMNRTEKKQRRELAVTVATETGDMRKAEEASGLTGKYIETIMRRQGLKPPFAPKSARKSFRIVKHLLDGKNASEAARAEGVSRQYAHQILCDMKTVGMDVHIQNA